MRIGKRTALIIGVVGALAISGPRAEIISKAYKFKANTRLEIGLDIARGVRLDSVEFGVPTTSTESPSSLFGQPKVDVSITNVGSASARIGVIIAVLDDDGRLLGVASGGTKVFPLRSERQMTYSMSFDDVSSELGQGTTFRISVEAKP